MLRKLLGLTQQHRPIQDLNAKLRHLISKSHADTDPDADEIGSLCRAIRGQKLSEFRQNALREFGHILPDSSAVIPEFTDRFAIATHDGVIIMGRFFDRIFPYAPNEPRAVFGRHLEGASFYDRSILTDDERHRLNPEWKVAHSFDSEEYPEVTSRLGGFRYVVIPASSVHGLIFSYNGQNFFHTNIVERNPISDLRSIMKRLVQESYDTDRMISDISITLQSVESVSHEIRDFKITHIFHQYKGCFGRSEMSNGMFGKMFRFATALDHGFESIPAQLKSELVGYGDPDGEFLKNQMNPDTAMR